MPSTLDQKTEMLFRIHFYSDCLQLKLYNYIELILFVLIIII